MTVATLPRFGQRVTARTRPPADHEIVVDSFAGVGGWGIGEEHATGWAIDVAINHDPYAIAAHAINHPATRHYQTDVFEVDPRQVEPGRRIAHCHFSPDCTHHSRARGAAPVSDRVRGLAWIVLAWAYHRRPRIITLENVEEFMDWGPTKIVGGKRQADRSQRGETFLAFMAMLGGGLATDDHPAIDEAMAVLGPLGVPRRAIVDGMGYDIEHRSLRACDYGAPTIRKRFYLIARCDGEPIRWPEPTHGDTRNGYDPTRPYARNQQHAGNGRQSQGTSNAAPEGMARHSHARNPDGPCPGRRARDCGGGGRGVAVQINAGADHRHLIPYRTAAECIDWSIPCPSIFLTPEQAQELYDRTGIRVRRPLKPATLRRIANGVIRFVVQAARPFIAQCNHGGGMRARSVDEPMATLTASRDAHGLVVPHLVNVQHASSAGVFHADKPMPTITAFPKGGGHAVVAAFLSKHYGGVTGTDLRKPIGTITGTDHHAFTAAHLVQLRGTCRDGQACDRPLGTLTSGGNHVGLVAAFLQTYYGSGSGKTGTAIDRPMPTIVGRDRVGLVTVTVEGEQYVIADIGMRMLRPHELLRAQFGRFADGWVLTGTQAQQVAGIGNSVCPDVSYAIAKANVRVRRIAEAEAAG